MTKRSQVYFAFKKLGVGHSTHRCGYVPKAIRKRNKEYAEWLASGKPTPPPGGPNWGIMIPK